MELNIDRPVVEQKEIRLKVEHVSVDNEYGVSVLDDVNFEVYSGEILGIAGISGCSAILWILCLAALICLNILFTYFSTIMFQFLHTKNRILCHSDIR